VVVTVLALFEIIAAVVVGILSVARLTRLLTVDTWPPVVALRDWWDSKTSVVEDGEEREGPWYALVSCPYCAAPWLTIPILAWAVLSDTHWTWWLFNGWLAVAYIAAIIVVKDGE
jgi:hypothetical protein